MAFGPGKYDDIAQQVLEQTDGMVVVVAVVAGNRGHGISHKAKLPAGVDAYDLLMSQADVFRKAADSLAADARKLRQQKRGN